MKVFLGVIVISLIIFFNLPKKQDGLLLTMLDIGQGDSILIQTPEGLNILVDAGIDNTVLYELGKVLPWWDRQIDILIMTHSDLDHYGGFNGVLEKYDVKQFWSSGDQSNATWFKDLQNKLSDQINIKQINRGNIFKLSEDLSLEVIWPPVDHELERNAASVVLYLKYLDKKILLTGDISVREEEELVTLGLEDIDILKVAHHGSRDSSASSFLDKLQPEVCLISAGLDNSFNHPHPEAISRLESVGCDVLTTITEGRIAIRLYEGDFEVLAKP